MLGLTGLCGNNHVERTALSQVILPAATETHMPIAHDYLADLIEDRLNENGMKVINSGFVLARGGSDMFGLYEVGSKKKDEFATVVGFRNSHVKKLSAGLVVGRGVFVCDNLMFEGEIHFGRRHTNGKNKSILDSLGGLITDAIGKVIGIKEMQDARAAAYKEKMLTVRHADHLIVQMLRDKVINTQRIEKVVAEWDTPTHKAHKKSGRSVWRMEQAVTESLKGSNIIQMPERCNGLVQILDSAARFKKAA